jgi:hypothetical protein
MCWFIHFAYTLYNISFHTRIHYFLYVHMYFHAVSSDHDFARISNFQRRDRSFRHSPPFIEFQTLKTSVRFGSLTNISAADLSNSFVAIKISPASTSPFQQQHLHYTTGTLHSSIQ